MNAPIQLITAFLGSLGFAMLFNVRGRRLLPASFGGFLAWSVYLLAMRLWPSEPLCYLIASAALTVWAEILARLLKAPATLFIVTAAIPLIPGGSLYHTMEYAILGDAGSFLRQGVATLLLAASIAAGILITMAVLHLVTQAVKRISSLRARK